MKRKNGFDQWWFGVMQVLLILVGAFLSIAAANASNGGIGLVCFLLFLVLAELRTVNHRLNR